MSTKLPAGRVAAFVLAAFVVVSSVLIMNVARSEALRMAGDLPFCVQVAGLNSYREVSRRADMLGFRMLGHGPYHHAVLGIGDLSNLQCNSRTRLCSLTNEAYQRPGD